MMITDTLKIQLLNNNCVLKEKQMSYEGDNGFFIALVKMCDDLQIEVPIWTMREDRLLDKYNEVTLILDESETMSIIVSKIIEV